MKALTTGVAAAVALLAVACGPNQATREHIAQLEAVATERDSLMTLIAENARAMSEIGQAIAGVETAGQQQASLRVASESPLASSRDSLVARVQGVAERLQTAETRLDQSRRRLRLLTRQSDSLSGHVTQLEQSIATFQAALDAQRATVAGLNQQIASLQARNTHLAAERDSLNDSVTSLAARAYTAYYIVGTESELLDRGIIRKEGGSRFLFIFGRRGQTLVPARDLDPSQFIAIDARRVQDISLPDSAAGYTIASRQDIAALETRVGDDGRIHTDTLRIADPGRFWQNSRYLILVRKG